MKTLTLPLPTLLPRRGSMLAALALLAGGLAADELHVPADYATIQEALDAAVSGDVVSVAPGTYTETGLRYNGKDITLRGTDGAAATILDGELSGRIFLFDKGETAGAVLEGFTIKNGRPGGAANQGGAMVIQDASPVIRDCVFRDNETQHGFLSAAADGGAVYLLDASPRFERCTFRDNAAGDGGTKDGGDGGAVKIADSGAWFEDCVFLNNEAGSSVGGNGGRGGAIYANNQGSGATLTILRCEFTGNLGGDGNSQSGGGGGVHVTVDSASALVMSGCTVSKNLAGHGLGSTEGAGGGMLFRVEAASGSSPSRIADSLFDRNEGRNGSGLRVVANGGNSTLNLENVTIADNIGGGPDGGGLVINGDANATVTVRNSILRGNQTSQLHTFGSAAPTVTYTCGDAAVAALGGGNINANPLFVGGGDYHLTATSPCIDVGDPDTTGVAEFDIDGDLRGCSVTDMGADEIPVASASQTVRNGLIANPEAFELGLTGPVIGQVWDPVVSHDEFAPLSVLDFVGIANGPFDVALPGGSILINPAGVLATVTSLPGAPFAIPIPDNCAFAGLPLYTQGGSLDIVEGLVYANAIDLVLGL